MADGRWQMADGKWQMANGRWQMADGRRQLAEGYHGQPYESYGYMRTSPYAVMINFVSFTSFI